MAKNINSIEELNNDPDAAKIREYISEWLKNNPNGETSALQAAIKGKFGISIELSVLESLMNNYDVSIDLSLSESLMNDDSEGDLTPKKPSDPTLEPTAPVDDGDLDPKKTSDLTLEPTAPVDDGDLDPKKTSDLTLEPTAPVDDGDLTPKKPSRPPKP